MTREYFIYRYAYIFWLENPAAFHDNFWCLFINIWVNAFSFISQLAWHLTIPRQPIGYYICSGIDLTDILKTPLTIYGLLEVSSLLLNAFIWIRIKIYKNKENNTTVGKTQFLADLDGMSMANLGMVLINLLMFLLFIINQVQTILGTFKIQILFRDIAQQKRLL